MSRLLERYKTEIHPALGKQLGIKNSMAVPRLSKVVISMGVGQAAKEKKVLESAMADMTRIAGQQGEIRRARKSVSNFKLREGQEIGCRVTLRGKRMFEFVDRLINVAIPRMRDFRGLPTKSFDGRGNYSMGVSDQTIFPEIDITRVTQNQGMNITFVTTSDDDGGARELLSMIGMPFRRT